jgi:TIR domain
MNLPKLFRLPLTRRSKIFISYRRDDSDTDADFLSERLARHFGKQQIFVDKDAIPIGKDFIETVKLAVASCDALLAVIGKQWLMASDGQERRLDDPNDIVRFEIASALCRDVLVIPILVRGARMPRFEELPGDLKDLARRHAFEISRAHRREDVEQLIVEIEKALSGQRAAKVRQPSTPAAAKSPSRGRAPQTPQINTRLAVSLSAMTLMIVLLLSLWLLSRSNATIVNNADQMPVPVSSMSPPSLESSPTPEQPQQEAPSKPSLVKTEQQSDETATDDTQVKSPQSIPSPTPSPQVATKPLENEQPKKGNEPPSNTSASPTSPTSVSMPADSTKQTDFDFGSETFKVPSLSDSPLYYPEPMPTPVIFDPLSRPLTKPTPTFELSPQEKDERWRKINEGRRERGVAPLPRPSPPRPRTN